MIPELAAALASIAKSRELLQAAIGVRDARLLADATDDALRALVEAREAAFLAGDRVGALEKEIADLQRQVENCARWDATEAAYQLHEPRPGLFLHRRKVADGEETPAHWACPRCFGERKVSILQALSPGDPAITCPACGFAAVLDPAWRPRGPMLPKAVPRRRGDEREISG